MNALLLDHPQHAFTLRMGAMPLPEPALGEIRVRLCAAALNPVDAKLATGGNSAWTYPHIPGVDGAGWVDALGKGVTSFAIGDRVLAHFPLSKPGTLAEFALIAERAVCEVPQTVSLLTAATLPCAAWTAWQALTRKLYLKSRQTMPTMLIEAAAGGVGGFAVQMAKHLGATVIATCSDVNRKYVSELGADHVIDYRNEDVRESVLQLTGGRGVDAVLDSLGGASGQRDLGLLAYAGSMACLINLPDVSKINVFRMAPSLHFITLGGAWLSGDQAAQLDLAKMGDEVLALLTTGAILPLPMTAVAFDAKAVTHALHQQLDGRVRGKQVVKIAAE
ncbi:MAG TPA: zinc-binding dehydrogenase [Rhodoferax sp.]|nr:zinc-binding dehydrogenase [Rhodoferax sp.]